MTTLASTYARARLRLGMSGVGLFVLLASAGLLTDAAGRMLPATARSLSAEAFGLLALFGLYLALQVPLDLLGGWILPRRHGRNVADGWLPAFTRWVRGVTAQALVFVASAVLMLALARRYGDVAAWFGAVGMMLVLIALQGALARAAGGFGRSSPAPRELQQRVCELVGRRVRVRIWEASDEGFTGGWFGFPRLETLVLPARWYAELRADELDAALMRRAALLTSGSRSAGLLLALGFNASGLALASALPGAGFATLAELMQTALGATLWTFVGLLVLPSVSRPAVLAADAFALRSGAGSGSLSRLIRRLDRWQDDEPSRTPLVETIFHPVPSVASRLAAVDAGRPARGGAWHAARMALFLTWGSLGLLSRAVHCNAGRPQLWVALPAD